MNDALLGVVVGGRPVGLANVDLDVALEVQRFSARLQRLNRRLLGLNLNWDFAKQWNFSDSLTGFETSFWVGRRF